MSDLLYDANSGHFSGVTPCEPAKSSPEDADDLVSTAERVCGEAYQLLSAINYCYPAMIPNAERWLDNLSRARLVHDDLLPVTIARPPASEAQAPAVHGAAWNALMEEETKESIAKLYLDSLAELVALREKLALAEHKGWNDAIEAVVNTVKDLPACPFDGPCSLTPTDPCPVCGDKGDDPNSVSHCRSPLSAIRALVKGEKC